jgi:quercetin dioxygenase-like cupin family protein
MRRLLLLLPLAAVVALAASAMASDDRSSHHQSGVTVEPLAQATIGDAVRAHGAGIQLRTNGPKAIMTAAITVAPGGSFGWHSHPGPVQVVIASGTFSLSQVENRRCKKHTFGPGDAFVEDARRVHLGQNESGETVRIYATFLARAGTTEFSRPEETPEPCRR